MEIIIKIQIDGKEVKDVKLVTEIEGNSKGTEPDGLSNYARWFDDGCVGWTKDAEYNLMFLRQQQIYANDKLRTKGYLFLNDVYDMLGIPRTKAGQVVGWIYDSEHPIGDNFVDFGLHDRRNADFINGYDNKAILDFNVDGNILDRI